MSLYETLGKIGLNSKEIKVYITLLKTGRVTPAAISRLTKIHRATVYNIANSLLGKGIIAQDLGGKTLYLTPLPPEKLKQMIERPKRELKQKEDLIDKAIDELSMVVASKEYPVPKIRFVEEGDLENFLYENFIKWNNDVLKNGGGTWWGFQDPSILDYYEKWTKWVINTKEYKDARIKTRFLSNFAPIEGKLENILSKEKRHIRQINGMAFTSSLWIGGDYLIMISTQKHPYYLVEIHDATLAQNMREVYKKLWELTS